MRSDNDPTNESNWYLHRTRLSTLQVGHTITAINENQMMIIGGKKVELFDISSRTLTRWPDIATERSCHSSVVLDDYIYLIGGHSEKSVHRMNLSKVKDSLTSSSRSSLWETDKIPNLNRVRYAAAAVANDDHIYLFGGQNKNLNALSSCVRYKPYALSKNYNDESCWETIASLKTGRCYHAAVSIADKIYILGGIGRLGRIFGRYGILLDSMEIYNTSKNKFEDGPSLPIPLRNMTAVSIGGKYIVVNGGRTTINNSTLSKKNEKTFLFDVNQQIWKSMDGSPTMNSPRAEHAATVLQKNKIVVCGGYDNAFDTIEWISLNELLHGKFWDRRKEFIILRKLVEKRRASLSPAVGRLIIGSKRKRKSEIKEFQQACLRYLIQNSDNDVFYSVIKFL